MQDAYREALIQEDILPLANADVEVVQAEEGKPLIFKATVPVRPEVDARRLHATSTSRPRSRPSTTPASTRSSRSCATRTRPSRRSRTAARRTATTRSSRSSARATASRSRAARPTGCRSSSARSGSSRASRRTSSASRSATRPSSTSPSPRTTASRRLAGQTAHFAVEPQGAAREDPARARRRLPGHASATSTSLDALRDGHPHRLEAQRPRPGAPRVRRPDHRVRRRQRDRRAARRARRPGGRGDARRVPRLARPPGHHRGGVPQGGREDAATTSTPSSGPNAEKRVKTLLVLSKVADAEGVEVPDADVEAEVAQGRERYAGDAAAGRRTSSPSAAARSSAARCAGAGSSSASSTRWLAAHPEHPAAAAPRGQPGVGRRQRAGPGQRLDRRDRPGRPVLADDPIDDPPPTSPPPAR